MRISPATERRRLSIGEQQSALKQTYVRLNREVGSRIDKRLHELVKLRVSMVNGCAYCLEMHTPEGGETGLPQEKLDLPPAWLEAQRYEAGERAALALADAVTAPNQWLRARRDRHRRLLAGRRHCRVSSAGPRATLRAREDRRSGWLPALARHLDRDRQVLCAHGRDD
ncbi:AhpD family alkylhydroperoxidase [Kribbella sp. VKM Ac-2571]|uniref:carboxymuconolactone decarboxylase family protein n=1 Tax=Kribbella sp. VKM Ac-2571 TaxID=2512222 RepID=UPI0010D8912E|nr:carboxymuconolactone decarboxylase family protein [Kribbella sp. VKM Ac-2571]TDO56643.1 AhpD family alkylhydroperoxidase [Kribbella sp. VKM Ac-2571]